MAILREKVVATSSQRSAFSIQLYLTPGPLSTRGEGENIPQSILLGDYIVARVCECVFGFKGHL
jgi:hypothetical protein